MKQSLILLKQFMNKEKILIIMFVYVLLTLSMFYTYYNSVYCQGYMDEYKDAALEFFYYIQLTGLNPFIFMILMLLLPNIVSYNFLDMQQNHTTYLIETRIGKKKYYIDTTIKNFIISSIAIMILEILMLINIQLFFGKIAFNTMTYPEGYHILTQTICSNEILNLIYFLILTSIGYGLLSVIIFSLQVFIPHIYLYRCSGVILGISLVVFPILLKGYFPIEDIAVLLQISPLTAIGVEHLRDNPFGFTNIMHYTATFSIYLVIALILLSILYTWRKRND